MSGRGGKQLDVPSRQLHPQGAWPCFSPDGRQVLFTARPAGEPCRLMVMPWDGGEPRFVTPPDFDAKRPTWLPSSGEIVFNRHQRELWTLRLEPESLEPFLPDAPQPPPAYYHPCGDPRRRAVVVVWQYDTKQGRAAVLLRLTPGGEVPVEPLTSFPEVCAGRPGVSPDGQSVAFAGNAGRFNQGANQLWVVRPGSPPRRLELGPPEQVQARAPRWSPDGRWIACTSTRPAIEPDESTPKAIWLIRADGSEAHQLTDRTLNPLHVDWSPQQDQLVCGGDGCPLTLLELPPEFRKAVAPQAESMRERQA